MFTMKFMYLYNAIYIYIKLTNLIVNADRDYHFSLVRIPAGYTLTSSLVQFCDYTYMSDKHSSTGLQLSANVDRFVGHRHLLGGRLAALFLLRVPHEHDEGIHIDRKHQPSQVEVVAESSERIRDNAIPSADNSTIHHMICLRVIRALRKRECQILLLVLDSMYQHLDDHEARGRCILDRKPIQVHAYHLITLSQLPEMKWMPPASRLNM